MAFDIKTVGGIGTGKDSTVTITTPCQINSYAQILSISPDGHTLTIANNISTGAFGSFAIGSLVAVHVCGYAGNAANDPGRYLFATVLSVNSSNIVVDQVIPRFDLSGFACQLISIPDFDTMVVKCTLRALPWDATKKIGGIIIQRAKIMDVTAGQILAAGAGLPISTKKPNIPETNAAMWDHWRINESSGLVVALASQKLIMSNQTRLGNLWSGATGAGIGGSLVTMGDVSGHACTSGTNGTALKGGDGGYGDVLMPGCTGGIGGENGRVGDTGKHHDNPATAGGKAGASLFICAPVIEGFCLDAISTGGEGGHGYSSNDGSPGGAGFGGGGAGGYLYPGGNTEIGGGGGGSPGRCAIATNTALPVNTTAYALDALTTTKTSMRTTSVPMDFSAWTSIDSITMVGTQPAGTDRRAIFKMADNTAYQKLTGAGVLSAVSTQIVTETSALNEGNTAAELAAVTGVAAWAGKKVYPVIAISGPGDGSVAPTVKLNVTGKSNTDTISKTYEYELPLAPTAVDIYSATGVVNKVNGGNVDLQIAAKKDGAVSSFVPLTQASTLRGNAAILRANCSVPSIASGAKVEVNKVVIKHRSNDAAVSGKKAKMITQTLDLQAPMRSARAMVRHESLEDAEIKAFCSFRNQPKVRGKTAVGVGTGNPQVFILGVKDAAGVLQRDTGINHDTIKVWIGSQPYYDFDFNTEKSEISFSCPEGQTVFASYSYGWEPEVWQEMQPGTTLPYRGINEYSTDYSLVIPAGPSKSVAAVQFELNRPEDKLTGYPLGTATGKTQMLYIPHRLKRETIVITISTGSVVWDFNEDSQILTIVGSPGGIMALTAEWIAKPPVVTGVVTTLAQ